LENALEHTVGIYIALTAVACIVGILTKWLANLPYTIALTLMGLGLAVSGIGPPIEETGFSKNLIFFVLLPPLIFQGALHMQLDRLRRHIVPVGIFATVGVIGTMLIIGGLTYGLGAFDSLAVAMLFGALICATDPVSVLAIFRRFNLPADLKHLVEGESLFNDGTGVVLYTVVLDMIMATGGFSILSAAGQFVKVTAGGALLGVVAGVATYLILKRLSDHLLENMICLVACYGSFWLAEHFHLSGVIAVVCVGLLLGNYGREFAMNPKTTETVETFFESIEFIINSLLFILIGLELQAISTAQLSSDVFALCVAVGAVTASRAAVVYPIFFAIRKTAGGYPRRWSHILFWGGLRGSIPIALLLGLPSHPALDDYRATLLVVGFGTICFSLLVQGLTMKPLIRLLGFAGAGERPATAPTSGP